MKACRSRAEFADEQKHEASHILDEAKTRREHAASQHHLAQQNFNQAVDTVRQLSVKKQALEAIQADVGSASDSLPAAWQSLNVTAGAEVAVELVLSHLGDPAILGSTQEATDKFAEDALPKGKRILLESGFVSYKPAGTLAAQLTNDTVPEFFTRIHLVENHQQALAKLEELDLGHSVLTQDGIWLSSHWVIHGPGQEAHGALKRQADIAELDGQLVLAEEQQDETELLLEQADQTLSNADSDCKAAETALKQAESQVADVTQKLGLIAMQLDQNQVRRDKITQDIDQQNALLEQEQDQLERLSEQVETLEAEIFELETLQQNAEEKMEQLQNTVNQTRQQYETITQQKHTLSMSVQQTQSEMQVLKRDCDRLAGQIEESKLQLETVKEEQLQLEGPEQDQAELLQNWLHEKQGQEQQKSRLQKDLAEIDDFLLQAQQGQQGIRLAIEQKQKVRESLLLEAEGFKARATGILEQLNETGKSIKDTMDSMPENAQEDEWARQLEQTSAAIKRLGAVNLAAVDEFKVQAERKAHLDAQNADLTEALETLQSAIRKIDKETRTRFSLTYEQVNNDLKALFPKVFGGGSAYLALTDDDLLETGVTIMARPPGKKNSTIHLLSGGEKALTALSLVFAIFRLNPAPFCLLDEVDAPLDDANVGRFCKLVSEMSETVQFIYITHNKIAMEMASHLTGVTMAEPGVSRMVAVDVDEAVTLAQA